MRDVHPNKRLRNFSISAPDGKSKITSNDIGNMSEREYLALRKAIRKRTGPGNDQSTRKQIKELLRKLTIARKLGQQKKYEPKIAFTKKRSQILDAFNPARVNESNWKPLKKRKKMLSEINLDVFSLIDDPVGTFEKFHQIALAECNAQMMRLNFNDGMCYDMSPYLLLAILKNDLPHQHLQGGQITDEVAQVLSAVGLSDYMDISPDPPFRAANDELTQLTFDGMIKASSLEDVMPFSLRSGGGLDAQKLAESEQRDEKVATSFVKTLKEWVAEHNSEQNITDQASAKIRDVMTELFDNALRHGDPRTEAGEWHTVGVLQKKKNNLGEDIVVCNLAILNIGKTISETLDLAPEETKEQINKYVQKHAGAHPIDTLKTVCAMQDKISRIDPNQDQNAALNGIGLMDSVLNVMNPLFGSNNEAYQPCFTLISGRSWLSVKPYFQANGEIGSRTLAFNENNDITEPPDDRYAKTLSYNFPGTIISLRFVIGADKLSASNQV